MINFGQDFRRRLMRPIPRLQVGCGECASVAAARIAGRLRGLARDDPAGFERIGNQRNHDHCDQNQFNHKVFHQRPPKHLHFSACVGLLKSPITAR
jgi:hypothetical protein